MLFYLKNNNYKEITRSEYYNDSDYYNEIINHIFKKKIKQSKYNDDSILKIINSNNIYIDEKNKKK